jgi:predicted Na+-dependent transporter
MQQTKIESLIEATVNTILGFVITLAFLPIVNYIWDIKMSASQMTGSTFLFTMLSVVRGYVIRRFFNNLKPLKSYIIKTFEK